MQFSGILNPHVSEDDMYNDLHRTYFFIVLHNVLHLKDFVLYDAFLKFHKFNIFTLLIHQLTTLIDCNG